MNVEAIYDPKTYTLTYVVYDADSKDAVIIDPVMDYDAAGSTTSYESVDRTTQFVKGAREGAMTDYWPQTGQPKRTVPYRADRVHGIVTTYYSDGTLKSEQEYKDDLRDGPETHYAKDGSVTRSRLWRDDDPVEDSKE